MSLSPKLESISVVIPVYNAAESIGSLVDELVEGLDDKYLLEIVLINDGSLDNSIEVCIAKHYQYKNLVSFYSLSKNVGEHNAVMAGLNNALGDYVVVMDDDFQNPVSEVPKLINCAIDKNYDVVYGIYERKRHSFFRNAVSRINDKLANVFLNKPKNLYLSSFKLIKKDIVEELIKYTLPYPYLDGLILGLTENIGKVNVLHAERKIGRSSYTTRKLFALWLDSFTSFSILPLRISTILGFGFALVGLVLGGQAVAWKITDPNIPLGYTSIIVFVSIVSGVQLVAIGILGEYLGRIFMSINRRPQYFISTSYKKAES